MFRALFYELPDECLQLLEEFLHGTAVEFGLGEDSFRLDQIPTIIGVLERNNLKNSDEVIWACLNDVSNFNFAHTNVCVWKLFRK